MTLCAADRRLGAAIAATWRSVFLIRSGLRKDESEAGDFNETVLLTAPELNEEMSAIATDFIRGAWFRDGDKDCICVKVKRFI